jgi:hypothetical protein
MVDKVLVLTAALSEAATNLSQAAETLRRHGLHEKAAMYDADAQAARSVLQRVRDAQQVSEPTSNGMRVRGGAA